MRTGARMVSISSEMPAPCRRQHRRAISKDRWKDYISSEMPVPWRPEATTSAIEFTTGFNLKRDASPVATRWVDSSIEYDLKFQSQARCQPRGDRWQQANDGLS